MFDLCGPKTHNFEFVTLQKEHVYVKTLKVRWQDDSVHKGLMTQVQSLEENGVEGEKQLHKSVLWFSHTVAQPCMSYACTHIQRTNTSFETNK